jgi:hypothetical protein
LRHQRLVSEGLCDRHFIFSTSHKAEPSQRGLHADTQLFSSLLANFHSVFIDSDNLFRADRPCLSFAMRKQEFVAEFDTVQHLRCDCCASEKFTA